MPSLKFCGEWCVSLVTHRFKRTELTNAATTFFTPKSVDGLSSQDMVLTRAQSDNNSKVLLYQCRNCAYAENAVEEPGMAACVYKNDLLTVAREQAGETKDLETDPTLQRSSIECPNCHQHGYVAVRVVGCWAWIDRCSAVFYQDQARRITTNMTLFYHCVHCKHLFRDPNVKHR
jgi:DNA-directed RNA polymerase II subunit RPB9